MMIKKISIITPCYNEECAIDAYYSILLAVINENSNFDFEIIFIDDGSQDSTLSKLIDLSHKDNRVRVIELSRNFGKEAALTAGIDAARGDAIIPMDADLQDPPELVHQMIAEWVNGADVVLAKRVDRSSDSFLKRSTAELFYRVHNILSSVPLPENVGDYRLMDRSVIEALKRLPERNRFMKGLFAWVGFKTVTLEYTRNPRVAGETKFSGWKLWNFAIEGITSFSTAPLKLWMYVGIFGAFITFLFTIFIIINTLFYGVVIPGYASLLIAILFFGNLQLITVGVLGEYIGRIYMETKNRPLYFVRKEHCKK